MSQELPPSKIDTPILVQADREQTKESCKRPERRITEISKKLPRLFGGVRSYHRAKQTRPYQCKLIGNRPKIMQKSRTQNYRDFQKVTEVVWGSQELPPSKIDTPISAEAERKQTKECCTNLKRKFTEIYKKLPRLFGGVRSYHQAKQAHPYQWTLK